MLSGSEKLPDHPFWKLSSLLPELAELINHHFLQLVADEQENPDTEIHNFRGFWLPAVDLRARDFTKPVDFYEAVFLQTAIFSEARFGGKVSFSHAEFRGEADFLSASFEEGADFSQARFKDATLFSDSLFKGVLLFDQAVIGREVVFDNNSFDCSADFSYIKIAKDAELVFMHSDLSKSCFSYTDLEPVDFTAVEWFRPQGTRSRHRDRAALWDEFRPLESKQEKRNYERIAENYRQLVLNYEAKRDFESAEDFHFGEMEIRRKQAQARVSVPFLKPIAKYLNSYYWYWKLSRYGTSYWVALGWLLGWLLVIAPIGVLFGGFGVVDVNTGRTAHMIRYQSYHDFAHPWQLVSDYLRAVSFTIYTATLQRSRLYDPARPITGFWMSITSIFTAVQSALLLFAVRRRFRR